MPPPAPPPWDLFCRVIDNHGDVGVCWRLAADLAARGERVRLWLDDASALAWMAPGGADGVEVHAWPAGDAGVAPGAVVIEAFGCDLPAAFVERMAALPTSPLWINLEYLSAEDFGAGSHRLPSPQPNGLVKWFFYPGFTPDTGGLLREPGLLTRQAGFDAAAWLAARGLERRADEQVVSLFCYRQPALDSVLDALAVLPTLLLTTFGPATEQVRALLGPTLARGALRAAPLPPLTQSDYDRLLWASDFNLVRGEDSFVRAQWAGRPFLWQVYPQHDGAHLAKLDAFVTRFLAGAGASLSTSLERVFRGWNGASAGPLALPPAGAWAAHCLGWRDALAAQTDLATQLLGFRAESR